MSTTQSTTPPKIQGTCACGKLKFSSSSAPTGATNHCYCTTCRKASGAAYLPFAPFKSSDITWEGTPNQWRKTDAAIRHYCAGCGSSVAMTYHTEHDTIWIVIGVIDEGVELVNPVDRCIYVGEKTPWAVLPDGVPTSETF